MVAAFGRYTIIRALGAGGMADVYLARDSRLGRQVAVKAPRVEQLSPVILARFEVEAQAIAGLTHRAIVPLYDYGEQDGRPYLVMPYMPGGSLAGRLEGGLYTPAKALPILERIAAALDYAHAHNVIHRDVKPDNILFDDEEEAFLSDFGIARVFHGDDETTQVRLTAPGYTLGTAAYVSPEQVRGIGEIGAASDVYSLGVVLFEMLAGRVPYGDPSSVLRAAQHVKDPLPSIRALRPALPEAIEVIVQRALAKQPQDRYATAGGMVAALRQAAAPPVIQPKPPAVPATPPKASVAQPAGQGELRDPVALAERGKGHRDAGRHEAALADLTRAIELKPDYALALARRGDTYRLMSRYNEALADFDRALQLNPKLNWVVAARGDTYRLMSRYNEALADFNQAIQHDPNYTWAFACRGDTYRLMQRNDEALTDLNRALELEPSRVDAIANRGRVFRGLKRYEESLADFNQAVALQPNNAWAIAGRGETYRLMERYDEALADFDRAIELDPNLAWAIASRGQTYRLMGRYDEALADFDRAIELDPNLAWAIAERGNTYRLMGRCEEALTDLNHALELEPDRNDAIVNRGRVYRVLERYDEALTDFNRALELQPDDAWSYAGRAESYWVIGNYDQAVTDFDRALELDSTLDWAVARRGMTHRQRGEYEAALADFDKAVELNPDSNWYYYLRAITWRIVDPQSPWRDGLNQAIFLAAATRQAKPADLQNLFNLALYFMAQGDEAAAEALYCEALDQQPAAPTLREAINDLDEYLRLFPTDELAARLRGLLAGE